MKGMHNDTPQQHQGLAIRQITKTYPGVKAVQDVSLDVYPGEVLALLGENGAGKSTLNAVIAGLIQPDPGAQMFWNGKPYAPASPREAMAAQIALIHQEMRLLPELTIAENVFVGRIRTKQGGFVDRNTMIRLAEAELQRLGMNIPATERVATLTVAAQQQVEIAKALTSHARLILLDEPTAALGGEETERLFEQIRRLRKEGVSFTYVSHRLDEIAQIADRIAVMRDGQLVAVHDTADVPVRTLVEEMVGRKIERLFPDLPEPSRREVLKVENLSSFEGAFNDITFSVNAGEIFGIAGIVGAGRTELVRAIAGADPIATGTISVEGAKISHRGPAGAMQAGIVMVPEDRKTQGLVLDQTLSENIALPNHDQIATHGWLAPKRMTKFAREAIRIFGVKGHAQQRALELSGGNQQKVVVAKWVSRNPKIVILDEPTRGIDVGARYEIYTVITELAKSGMAVVIVSSDLDEVLGMSHRVMALSRGKQRGILDRKDANSVAIMELATS
ncbi:ribose ABC transporter, ATP-binding protein [Candidatus Moduliflexus flocculans]|uniref:Ribose ABC transporter, ATP-binding protein n=1 Tax=Candidatus Moduliflexus flocculans TaxID=1499966 RepID=A0A0S6W4B3_9BACT|nr:ribose ABC transporter, ATP-binding protein [Candidatus Moduliflexus flocculans]